ncbi:MAG: tryptophan synthase subunit beta [Bacteroidales bacterium]
MNTYSVSKDGYYGSFGGSFIPETLNHALENLQACYKDIIAEPNFQKEYIQLLKDYVGRPTSLYFAKRLSDHYGCKIYLKREDLNHTGAHKINNTLGQILLAKRMGKKRIIAETGAGQHGVATATVCALMGLECIVYMGQTDIERQSINVRKMEMLGAKVVAAKSGNMTLKDATNEAIRDWSAHPEETYYIIGSVVGPHPYPDMVARFQSIIGKEIKAQLQEKELSENPDYLIACIGGGSNAAGTIYDFLDNKDVNILLAEAAGEGIDTKNTAATLHLGTTGILHGAKTLIMQDANGQVTEPYSISAGLDYPGIGPMFPYLYEQGRIDICAVTDEEALNAAFLLTRLEGIIPALESAHAVAALEKRKFKSDDVIVLTISGRGDKDMDTYLDYIHKKDI